MRTSSIYSISERAKKIIDPRLTTDSKVTMQELVQAVGNVRDKLVMDEAYSQRYSNETIDVDEILKSYGYKESLNPEWDVDRNSWKLKLPALPIDLPHSAGLRGVSVKCDDMISMVRTEPGSRNMFRGMFAAALPRDSYHRELDEIYFHQEMTEDMEMVCQIVPSSSSLSDREQVPIARHTEINIIIQVSEFYLGVKAVAEDAILNDLDD